MGVPPPAPIPLRAPPCPPPPLRAPGPRRAPGRSDPQPSGPACLSGSWPLPFRRREPNGRFGVGIKAYFVFLRYLLYMNLLHSVLVLAFILGPAAGDIGASFNASLGFLYTNASLDILLGTGFLERSPVFYGFYSSSSSPNPCLNPALLYLTGVLVIFSLSLIVLVRRMAVAYRRSWLLGQRHAVNLSLRVLSGWDFTVQDPAAAALMHGLIRNHLKLYLQEQAFSLREAQRTLPQWGVLYTLRVSLNLFVLSLLGGAFAVIYSSTVWSNEKLRVEAGFWRTLLFQYLPAVTMNLVNLLLPHIFRKVSSLEDYSLSTQVNATFMRSIFLKLASLGIFLFFIFKTDRQQGDSCWENQFGREMYKLVMLDFMASILITLLVDLPTRMLKDKCPSCWLARLSGKQRFQVPFNALNLVYNQTVLWAGVFYCPLLPLLGTVKLVTLFYFKKFKVLRCCAPEQRMFRAASSSVLFHFMLLLGLFMVAGTLGLDVTRSRSKPSPCGPFAGGSVLNSTGVCVASLPGPLQSSLRYLASGPFVVPLIMAEMLILNYFFVLRRANRSAAERLKHLLVTSSADKRFLVLVLGELSADKKSDSLNLSGRTVQLLDPPVDPQQTP
ncbi:transmembrane channel-like protein 7 isoform X2 [Gadus macrocephalus]|uniref:transmembrane channel-like protein 7 isoform X2 n=1 Tax=Gadus macrocephalus TaxID=80720 RepID=UPI0028CB7ED9|nr:transmembrane channel-like protein 7 isoform X2 [Gadus macrocephalus]